MNRIPRTLLMLSLLSLLIVLSALSGGPAVQTTGAPAISTFAEEASCSKAGCHAGGPVNSEGQLEIVGLPETYVPGTNYPLTIRLTSSQSATTPRWGFELTNARLSDGSGSGTITGPGLNLNMVNNRTYIATNISHLYMGEHGFVEWQVSWTAPDNAEGPVAFYAAGTAADGNLQAGAGDLTYTTGETTQGGLVPVDRVSWGNLKSRTFSRP